jgi:Fe2+ or Zn2+ uptake regulation protein
MHVRKSHPRVSMGTVYRNLDRFVQEGTLRVRHIGGQRRYDPLTHPHAHLHCLQCDKLMDLPWEPTGLTDVHKHANRLSFKVQDHLLEIQGICNQCQGADPTSSK